MSHSKDGFSPSFGSGLSKVMADISHFSQPLQRYVQCPERKGFRGIILMDSMMPVMDGPDTIKNIVNENLAEGNIILMLTSRDEPDERLDEVKQYVVDYLAKPADVENLPDILKGYSEFLKEE